MSKIGGQNPMSHLGCDVLVIGSGAAGMYAALAVALAGSRVLLRRSQPDRPRRRDGHGADDRGGRARRGACPTTGSTISPIR